MLAILPILLAVSAGSRANSQDKGDKDAEALYKAMKEKIEGAKTLRFDLLVTIGESGRTVASFRSAVKAKGKDRWTMDVKLEEGPRGRSREQRSLAFLCDGRKVIALGGTEHGPSASLKPEEVGAEIRSCLVTSMISQVMYVEPFADGEANAHKPPEVGPAKSVGKEKVGEREAQILEYSIKYEMREFKEQPLIVKTWVDPATKRPLKRELGFQGILWTETFAEFAIDEEIPDSEFAFQSRKRLAQAMAAQLADSVRLFGHFTGQHPASLDELLRRPGRLEADVFWPEGGFVLGGVLPKDPWGRPFALRVEPGGVKVVSYGADGKAGGKGEDEDAIAPVPPVTRRAVGAPSDRLKKYYAARVHLHLLASAVRGFRSAYGELPKKKASLWEKPEWAEVWPEGGWIPGGTIPADPWGDAYRIVSDPRFVRVMVADPKSRAIPVRSLTAEEKTRLEAVAQPRLTDAEKQAIGKLLDEAGDDDLETREKAMVGLKTWGATVIPFLEARARTEKDAEARGRLAAARQEIPSPPPAYVAELSTLSITVGNLEGRVAGGAAVSNERNASATLKTLATAEADFRANDRDGNKVNDYWVGDVAGLYSLMEGGQSIKLIEVATALADAAPLEKGAAGGQIPDLADFGTPQPKAGYYFRVMTHDNSNGKSEPYAQETDAKAGKVHHNTAFGFCTYPAEYGASGTRTFIVNENNTIFWKDTAGEPVLEWPSDAELKSEWHRMD